MWEPSSVVAEPPLDPPEPEPPDPPLPPLEPPSFEPCDELPQLAADAISATNAGRMIPSPLMNQSLALSPLVRDIDLLCLDAGNTVVFLDHARVARLGAAAGFTTTAERLVRAEGEMKISLEEGTAIRVPWSETRPAAQGWAVAVGTMLSFAGLPREQLPRVLDTMWTEHLAHNLWSLVAEGLVDALARARATGLRVAVVSNAEGTLEAHFRTLGILPAFDLVIDSAIVGVEKPDPGIFGLALDRFGVPASRALHLGDTYATDVLGARAAQMRVALVDPHGHADGRHLDVPRVPSATELADAVAKTRRS